MGAARDPVAALVEFANLMRSRGGAKAGCFVTTGSWTGMVFTRHGTRIAADFGPLGRVEIAFPAA
jgi:2-keto-4-pentenoate hydratase